jgi:hypothetical protein
MIGRTVSVQPLAQPNRKRVWLPHEAPRRLAQLGLEVDHFHDALTIGDRKSRQVGGRDLNRKRRKDAAEPDPVGTGVYPLNYPGIVMWAESLASLRSILLRKEEGWEIGRSGNYETVFSLAWGIGIAIHTGDRWAGIDADHEPRLKRRRGRKAIERAEQNEKYVQLALPFTFGTASETAQKAKDESIRTYFLLPNALDDRIALELSLPTAFGPDGQVEEWSERILIAALPIANAVTLAPPDEDDDDGYDAGRIVDRKD